MSKSAAQGVSVSFPTASLLTILFIGLKLTNYIHWSWLWVLAPSWIPLALLFLFLGFLFVIFIAKELL
jgi:hypothetical protein